MAVPDFQSTMLPLLKFAGDNQEHSIREAIDYISDFFKLSEQERKEVLPSGQQYIIDNRVGWARTYMKKAGLLETPRRSFFTITDLGLAILKKNPSEINVKFLEQFPQFIEFRNAKKEKDEQAEQEVENNLTQTPQELLEYGFQKIRKDLSQELLGLVKQSTPRFFEKLVVELLLAMGYGGSRKDAGKAVGQSGDGGIDGIIKEDKLGLDVIYLQAKRWENIVGSKEIRNFVGSLVGQKANKGVFITTSGFTKDAMEYVKSITHKVILIDGEMLTQLMIENNIGVSKIISYDVKKIDSDYFIED
ncbi:MAG TPA: restriction endonuclease [Candidatus Moranbacteria bacterium]|nr:restriction endonuclease [Candidatus Moranbacteria bacterium]